MTGSEDMDSRKSRTVWENSTGSHLLTVTGLLQAGTYDITKEIEDDGTITLLCARVSDDEEE